MILPGFPTPMFNAGGEIEFVGSYMVPNPESNTKDYTLNYDGNLTGGIDNSVKPGDLVIAYWGMNHTGLTDLISLSAGWDIAADQEGNDSYDTDAGVVYKVLGSSPDASVDFEFDDSVFSTIGCHVFRGVDESDPIDDSETAASVGMNDGRPNPMSVTKLDPKSWIFAFGAAAGWGGSGTGDFRYIQEFTSSDLDGFVQITNGFIGVGAGYSATITDPSMFGGGSDSSYNSKVQVTMVINPG